MDGRMKCPGCVTPCEDCDKPLRPADYAAMTAQTLLIADLLEMLRAQDERITKLERIIEQRTGD